MKKIIVILASVLIFIFSCKKNERKVEGIRTEILNSVSHVYNPSKPLKGVIALEVEKTIQIDSQDIDSDNVFFFHQIEYDEDGNIYFADMRARRINKFSKEGKYITGFLKKGEGPGEFRFITQLQIVDNKIWVSGNWPRKIAAFDTRGNLIMEKQLKKGYRMEIVDENRFIGDFDMVDQEKIKSGAFDTIPFKRISALVNHDGKILTSFLESEKVGGWRSFYIAFQDFRITPGFLHRYHREKGMVYFAVSDEYDIMLKDLKGITSQIIHRKHENIKIKEKDIKEFVETTRFKNWAKAVKRDMGADGFTEDREGYKDLEKMMRERLPGSFCVIRSITLLSKGFIAISRITGLNTPFEIDIFDSKGRYLYLVKVPGEITGLERLKILKNGVAGLKHQEEKDIYMEYRVKNLSEIFGD